eukprot:2407592-Rhodomonas_salina.1
MRALAGTDVASVVSGGAAFSSEEEAEGRGCRSKRSRATRRRRCPVFLVAYPMSGTDVGYDAMRCPVRTQAMATAMRCVVLIQTMLLYRRLSCYAVRGTVEVAAPPQGLRKVQVASALASYALARQSPVLIYATRLWPYALARQCPVLKYAIQVVEVDDDSSDEEEEKEGVYLPTICSFAFSIVSPVIMEDDGVVAEAAPPKPTG